MRVIKTTAFDRTVNTFFFLPDDLSFTYIELLDPGVGSGAGTPLRGTKGIKKKTIRGRRIDGIYTQIHIFFFFVVSLSRYIDRIDARTDHPVYIRPLNSMSYFAYTYSETDVWLWFGSNVRENIRGPTGRRARRVFILYARKHTDIYGRGFIVSGYDRWTRNDMFINTANANTIIPMSRSTYVRL